MSDLIFSSVPGRIVKVLAADDAQTFRLIVKDQNGDLDSTGIVTGVRVGQRVAAQLQVTLDESLFVVPFGDEAGQMTVTLVHGMLCTSGSGTSDGVQRLLQWYKANKLQRAKTQPVTLAIGASVFKGYVLGSDLDAQAAEGGMVRSQLSLVAWNVQ
ncbi:MAG TPA: hypothetical protein PLS53_00395 [Thermoanaerobaculaceae bacterium]|nr:hypothetical protein [Thermoanaerobaculaceae bacterium]HPS76593.1 hypothetical protein [Thermoanaerobaculaceae bacterium]